MDLKKICLMFRRWMDPAHFSVPPLLRWCKKYFISSDLLSLYIIYIYIDRRVSVCVRLSQQGIQLHRFIRASLQLDMDFIILSPLQWEFVHENHVSYMVHPFLVDLSIVYTLYFTKYSFFSWIIQILAPFPLYSTFPPFHNVLSYF